jgi:hypothetical protein
VFKDGGTTENPNLVWSGERLIQMERSEALRTKPMSIDGVDFLFVEAGGFSEKNPSAWTSPWVVLKRP